MHARRHALAFAIQLLAGAAPAVAGLSFDVPQQIPVQTRPVGVAVGDFDGGAPDIVCANTASQSITFIHNNGDRTFAPPTHIPIGLAPRVLRAADFDGDSKLDLVASVDQGGAVPLALLLGNGSGGFATPAWVGTPGVFPASLAVGDFDADGDPDVVAVLVGNQSEHAHQVAVFSNASGTLLPQTYYQIADVSLVYFSDVKAGDIDGDSDLDLFTTIDAFGVAVPLFNDGSGAFAAAPTLVVSDIPITNGLADFDGDMDLDAAIVTLQHRLVRYVNDGAGAFSAASAIATPVQVGISTRAVSRDLNGDARDEMIVAGPLGGPRPGLAIHENDGLGELGVGQVFPATGAQQPAEIATGDLDGNGSVDLVVSDRVTNEVYVYFNTTPIPSAAEATPVFALRAYPVPMRFGESVTVVATANRMGPLDGTVSLWIHDAAGRLVRRIPGTVTGPGCRFTWDGRDSKLLPVGAGVYYGRVDARGSGATVRIAVLR